MLRIVIRGRSRETWFFGQDHVYLGARPVHFDAADSVHKIRRQFTLRDQFEKSPLGVGIRQHEPSSYLGPVFKHDSARAPVSRINLRHRGAGPNLYTESTSRRSHRFRDGAHAAHDMSVKTL